VSLSRIADYCFELALSSAGAPSGTERFSVFGQAVHPITGIPISGISWKTRMVVDDKEISPVSIKMHEDAFVEFVFDAPALEGIREPMKSITVEAVGRRGDFEQESSINLWLNQWFSAKFQSDKPIYQPGQTMHMRAVILDANGKAAPNEKIILRIEDQNNERVHYSQMVSSKFGIVQDEWTISSSAAIGDYSIKLTREGSDNYGIAYHHVRISRYELPSFRVDAKADQRAYLLGEQPRVTVSGTYLFGKPVPKGKVKIVRVYDPEWNFEKAQI